MLWLTAFDISVKTSLIVGILAGFLLGILLSIFGKAARLGGNVNKKETVFVSGSILTMLAMFLVGTGVLAWIVKLIFF